MVVKPEELLRKQFDNLAKGLIETAETSDEADSIVAALAIANYFVESVGSIADSVGKIARAMEQDVKSQAENLAEQLYDERKNEATKRSFIGQPD